MSIPGVKISLKCKTSLFSANFKNKKWWKQVSFTFKTIFDTGEKYAGHGQILKILRKTFFDHFWQLPAYFRLFLSKICHKSAPKNGRKLKLNLGVVEMTAFSDMYLSFFQGWNSRFVFFQGFKVLFRCFSRFFRLFSLFSRSFLV